MAIRDLGALQRRFCIPYGSKASCSWPRETSDRRRRMTFRGRDLDITRVLRNGCVLQLKRLRRHGEDQDKGLEGAKTKR